jgi:signal transduction histidine kinase/CheY-like chemotaxis protein
MAAFDVTLFQTERPRVALEKYAAITHLAVRVYDRDERVITSATDSNPLFELLAKDRHPYLLGDCVKRCFTEPDSVTIVVEHDYRIAVVGVPMIYEGEVFCAAIAAYALVGHLDQRQAKLLALNNGLDFHSVWGVVRRSLPISQHRLPLYGELLRIIGETFVSEHQHSCRLEETLARLEVADRSKDEFLAILSHELRGPLHAIVGWTQVLRLGRNDAALSARALDGIEESTKEQTKLISELLDVSCIIAGKLTLDFQPIELVPIIKRALESVRNIANEKQIRIQSRFDPSHLPLRGDADRLRQVCSNLLTNAVKFTPLGGSVTVELERLDSCVQIQVSDTGRGISPELLTQIFEKFRQADSSITREQGGLGLGLAIVKHLVELHGGNVRAESAGEGQGSTFTVTLPLLDAPLQEREHKASVSDRRVSQLDDVRVWVVDDDVNGRAMMNTVLEMRGAQVTALASGSEALQMLDEASPDVLVCDIAMPGMDGYTLMRKIRSREPRRGGNVPAIAVTGFAAVEDRERALSAGFQTYLAKPIDPEELARAIGKLVQLRA